MPPPPVSGGYSRETNSTRSGAAGRAPRAASATGCKVLDGSEADYGTAQEHRATAAAGPRSPYATPVTPDLARSRLRAAARRTASSYARLRPSACAASVNEARTCVRAASPSRARSSPSS
jgi:hypothetical protein